MKILIIGLYGGVGGAENVMKRDINLLIGAGHEVAVIYGDRKVSPDFQPAVKKYYLEGMRPDFTVGGQGSVPFLDILKTEKSDIVNFHNCEIFEDIDTISGIISSYLSVITVYNYYLWCPAKSKSRLLKNDVICQRHLGLPCLFCKYVFGGQAAGFRTMVRRYRKVKQNIKFHNRAARIIVINEHMRKVLVEIGIERDKISIVTPSLPGIDDIEYSGYGERPNKILFVGRILYVKGAQFLLQASRYIEENHTISIIGDGDYLVELRRMAKSLGIDRRVLFHGEVDDEIRNEEYRTAAVMVVPSIWPETFGLIGQEAISYGLPVVAFDVGGISTSWCFNGENGYLVKPGDTKMLAQRINALLKDKRLADKMSVRSRQIAIELFRPKRHLDSLLSAYRQAIFPRKSGHKEELVVV